MREETFEAETVDAAVERAASQWSVDPTELEYEVVEESSEDFWGLEDTTVKVRVRHRDEEQAAPAAEGPQPAEPEAGPREHEEEAGPPAEGPEGEDRPAASVADEEPAAEAAGQRSPVETREEPAGAPAGTETSGAGTETSGVGTGAEAARSEPEAAPAEDEAAPVQPEPEPAGAETMPAGAPRAGAEEMSEIESLIDGLLHRVFDAIDFDCTARVQEHEDTIHVQVGGEDKKFLLERKGRALSSLQLILNHAFRHRDVGGNKKIRVDAGDFRERREEELQDLAFQVAHRAKETGSPQETQELNPYERRLVHLALADDPAVSTKSQGRGFLKPVLVSPEGGGQG